MHTPATVNIELRGVSFVREGRAILSAVNWRVPFGQHWAVVGANGSGKTTLLGVLVGYLWPSEGRVWTLGEELGQTDLRQLRRRVGWVSSAMGALIHPSQTALQMTLSGAFGSTALFDRPSRPQVTRARGLLKLVGLQGRAAAHYGVLSLGEQQRVLIARALMARPELLVLDEACAGLDIAAREHVLAVVEELARTHPHMTLLLVTHHIEEIPPACSHVLVLRGGKVLAKGPKEIVLSGAVLSRAFGVPIEVYREGERWWPRAGGKKWHRRRVPRPLGTCSWAFAHPRSLSTSARKKGAESLLPLRGRGAL
jgi:iron complex transport system ATP-binding protein